MKEMTTNLKEMARQVIVAAYHRIPGVRNRIGLPSGFYPSTINWAAQTQNENGLQITTKEIYPAHKIERTSPKTIEPEIHKNFTLSNVSYTFNSAPVHVTEVQSSNELRLWGPNAATITPDNQLLGDAPGEFYVDPNQSQDHSIFLQWRLPPLSNLSGKVAELSAPGSHSYFHWMLNALPRFHLLQANGMSLDSIDHFVLSLGCNTRFHHETLATLNIPLKKIVLASWQFHAQVNHLIIPSMLCLPAEPQPEDVLRYRRYGSFTGNVPRWACDFVRSLFLPPDTTSLTNRGQRIYITRKTSIRQVLNEPELIDILTRYGFETVDLATLSVAEQAILLDSAEAVVAVHGAGLTNLTFCRAGTKVIEIFAKNYVKLTYWGLCNLMNLDYYYLLAEADQVVDESNDFAAREQNVIVPRQKLINTLKLAGLTE